MVNSRFPPAKFRDAEGSGEELDIPLSQESVGDEDNRQEIAKMIEKLYADNLEKKRAQREKKILEYTEHQLNYELEASAKVVQDALQEIERLYEAFLTAYAACEDRIRKKWGELHDAEIELLKFGQERSKNDEDHFRAAAELYDKGLSKMKISCQVFQETIQRFLPADAEDRL